MSGRNAKPLAALAAPRTPAGPGEALSAPWDALNAGRCVAYAWDLTSDEMTWSPNIDAVFGAGAAHRLATGRDFLKACGIETRAAAYHAFQPLAGPAQAAGIPYEALCRLRLTDSAAEMRAMDQGRWFAGADGQPARAIGTVHLMPAALGPDSGLNVDALTGIATRRHLLDAVTAIRRTDDPSWALFLVGLDDLGRINERFGFEAADQLIVSLAGHLRSRLKAADLLVRFSGNKFAILVTAVEPAMVSSFGEALIEEIRGTPLSTGAGTIPISVTIGAICAPQASLEPDQIVSRLQEAHERAKQRGRGRFFLDDRSSHDEGRRRINLRMADEIVHALDENRVHVALQPVVHAASRALAFSEALARIPAEPGHHPYGGQRLVAAAERLGLMGGLDRAVLQKVAAAMRSDPTLTLSVNVSVSSIADEAWMRLFHRDVDETIGKRLIIELTESVTVDDLPAARQFISMVRKRGVRIAIDDFGAGATSFRNLRKLDVDIVKIDGSFVLHMIKSADDRAFVQALLALAHQLGIQTVAEWVQNETSAAMLLDWGCDYFQGALSGLAQPLREAPPHTGGY